MKSLFARTLSAVLLCIGMSVFVLAAGAPALAFAAPALPAGTAGKQAPASAGATELGGQGNFEAHQGFVEAITDTTELDLSAGGILNTGNSRNFAATSVLRFLARRSRHQFGLGATGNYGMAAVERDAWEPSTANAQGRVRYDVFMTKRWAAFLATTARNDRFQGLDLRLNIDPGFAHYFFTETNHRVWSEFGYDFQYDRRREQARYVRDEAGVIQRDASGDPIKIDKQAYRHAVRLFIGYTNKLDSRVSFDFGLEYLQSFLDARQIRVNADVSLLVQLAKRFSLGTTFTLKFDNDPLPGVKKIDTITAMSAVYRWI